MATTWSEMRSYAAATADQYTAASYGAARAYCEALFDGDEIETTRDMLNRIRREQRVASQAITEARQAYAAATDLLDAAEDEGMDPQLAGVICASVEGELRYQRALWDVLDAAADRICSIIEPAEVY